MKSTTLSAWIAQRFTSGRHINSRAAMVIAVAGVALSLLVMELTLSIVVGFKDGIRNKLSGFDAQLSVSSPYVRAEIPENGIALTPGLEAIIRSALPQEAEIRQSIRQAGILKTDSDFEAAVFIGQSPDADFTFEKSNITAGVWPDYAQDSCLNHIVVSEAMARSLNLKVGDKVYSTFVTNGDMRLRRNTIAGIYNSAFGEYDRTIVYSSLPLLARVCGLDSASCTRIDIRGIGFDDIDRQADRLQHTLVEAAALRQTDELYTVDNIHRSGALYFNWLKLLDTNVAVILGLMMTVAAFTLISCMFIIVLERIPSIGILRSCGAPATLIRNIFVRIGLRIAAIGMGLGNAIAISFIVIQMHTGLVPLDPDMYYLSAVPVAFRLWHIIALNAGVFAAIWLVLLIPARLAARTDPATAVSAV